MIFKAKPHYAVSLSRLVKFNHLGEFHTEDDVLIAELLECPKVEALGEVENTKKVKEEVEKEIQEESEEQEVDELEELQKEYFEKFGKEPAPAYKNKKEWLEAKLAE